MWKLEIVYKKRSKTRLGFVYKKNFFLLESQSIFLIESSKDLDKILLKFITFLSNSSLKGIEFLKLLFDFVLYSSNFILSKLATMLNILFNKGSLYPLDNNLLVKFSEK